MTERDCYKLLWVKQRQYGSPPKSHMIFRGSQITSWQKSFFLLPLPPSRLINCSMVGKSLPWQDISKGNEHFNKSITQLLDYSKHVVKTNFNGLSHSYFHNFTNGQSVLTAHILHSGSLYSFCSTSPSIPEGAVVTQPFIFSRLPSKRWYKHEVRDVFSYETRERQPFWKLNFLLNHHARFDFRKSLPHYPD